METRVLLKDLEFIFVVEISTSILYSIFDNALY